MRYGEQYQHIATARRSCTVQHIETTLHVIEEVSVYHCESEKNPNAVTRVCRWRGGNSSSSTCVSLLVVWPLSLGINYELGSSTTPFYIAL